MRSHCTIHGVGGAAGPSQTWWMCLGIAANSPSRAAHNHQTPTRHVRLLVSIACGVCISVLRVVYGSCAVCLVSVTTTRSTLPGKGKESWRRRARVRARASKRDSERARRAYIYTHTHVQRIHTQKVETALVMNTQPQGQFLCMFFGEMAGSYR